MQMSEAGRSRNKSNRCRGSALLEMAISCPIVILLFIGASDFARVFRDAIALTDAAHAGAFWGAMNTAHSGRFEMMESIANTSASDVADPDISADNFCDCPYAPATGPSDPNAVSCGTGYCFGYGIPRSFVRVRTGAPFHLVMSFPGVPSDIQVGRQVYMRVQ